MNPQARPVIKTFAQVLGVLAARCLIAMIAMVVLFSRLFRTEVEAPVPDLIAMQRLDACWSTPSGHPSKLLSYRKDTVWDGTTHEEWVLMVPGSATLDLNQRTSPYLQMDNARNTWPLPEVAVNAGYSAAPTVVYQAGKRGGGSGSAPPTMTDILIWPIPSAWIVHVRHTVVD